MKSFITFSILALALSGCAHGMKVPGSADEAQQMGQDEANAQTQQVQDDASAKAADVQSQAEGQVNDLQNKVTGGLVNNVQLGKAAAAQVLNKWPMINDSPALVYVNQVGQYMAQELVPSLRCKTDGTGATEVRVAIIKADTPASFSVPGGIIFLTTSLMQQMSSEDELAGVIATETVLSICEKSVPGNLAMQAANGFADYVSNLPTTPVAKNDIMFADKYALVTLYRRGYDVSPYASFIEKNENSGRHMGGAERAALLQKNIAATPAIKSTMKTRLTRFNAAKSKSM